MQKGFKFWQKMNPDARRLWSALILTLLVHGILLVLFKQTSGSDAQVFGELPHVGIIDLNDTGNRNLAQWISVHEPSLLIVPDNVNGFSRVLNTSSTHRAAEDLPNTPDLSVPEAGRTAARRDPGQSVQELSRPGKAEWMPGTADLQLVSAELKKAARPNAGKLETLVYKALNGKVAALKLSNKDDLKNLSETHIQIHPPRISGMSRRLLLIRSCGVAALDQLALKSLRELLAENPDAGAAGELFLDWRSLF